MTREPTLSSLRTLPSSIIILLRFFLLYARYPCRKMKIAKIIESTSETKFGKGVKTMFQYLTNFERSTGKNIRSAEEQIQSLIGNRVPVMVDRSTKLPLCAKSRADLL